MRINLRKDKPDYFKGDIRLHIESTGYFTHLEDFYQDLGTIGNLEVVFYAWSETTGLAILVSLRKPVPLIEKLRQMNIVEDAYKKTKKDIIVKLNISYSQMIASIHKSFKEGILIA